MAQRWAALLLNKKKASLTPRLCSVCLELRALSLNASFEKIQVR